MKNLKIEQCKQVSGSASEFCTRIPGNPATYVNCTSEEIKEFEQLFELLKESWVRWGKIQAAKDREFLAICLESIDSQNGI